jgi:hypothetical protein
MLNTVKDDARYPTIQWAFREPLFECLSQVVTEHVHTDLPSI